MEPRDGGRGRDWSWRSGRRREDLGGVEATRPERRGGAAVGPRAAAVGRGPRAAAEVPSPWRRPMRWGGGLGRRRWHGQKRGGGAGRGHGRCRGRKRGGGAGGGTGGSGAVKELRRRILGLSEEM